MSELGQSPSGEGARHAVTTRIIRADGDVSRAILGFLSWEYTDEQT
jgi:hypothetical protein